MRPHIRECRGCTRQRRRDGRGETILRVADGVAEPPFGGVSLFQPLVGGAALPARRVPRGLLGGGEFVAKAFEVG
jgi:hypothetical protein